MLVMIFKAYQWQRLQDLTHRNKEHVSHGTIRKLITEQVLLIFVNISVNQTLSD